MLLEFDNPLNRNLPFFRILAIRSSPQAFMLAGIQVFIGYPPNAKFNMLDGDKPLPMDVDDISAVNMGFFEGMDISAGNGVKYKSIRLDKLEGKNFLNKMEMLMAVLSEAI